ncbi:MAG: 8-amino-7-oxononanoate synthase [Steroidobacteraceae bacterium]|nr:8-amino-7-oxononanoate synthase [Steroidobacteraceae bacterium]
MSGTAAPDWRETRLRTILDDLAARGLARRRRLVEGYPRPEDATVAVIDGRELVSFCGNDYLGLARDPRVAESLVAAARRWGTGSGASHLVTGHHAEHHALEEELAAFVGRPRAALFSTGYMANLAVGTTLVGRGDHVYEDRLNHASLLDAGWLSGARFERYPHGDAQALDARLAALRASGDDREALVLTDGVFSMDGDLAPVRELARACRAHRAWLAVDDAHGLGVLGDRGGGTLETCGAGRDEVPVLVGTLGKAFGTFGAFVAGSEALVEVLVQKARTYVYTTALPPAVAAATRTALAIARTEAWRRERVSGHVARFRAGAHALGLRLLDSHTPIQPLILGTPEAALAASERLRERGLLVAAIRPPTVPPGSSRLRITFSAAHTESQVDRLLDALAALAPQLAERSA